MAYVNSDSYDGRYLQLEVTQTKGTSAQNYSTINWTLRTVGGSVQYTTGPTTVTIDGQQRWYKARTGWSTGEFPAKAGSVSGSFIKYHNNDGTCGAVSFSLSTAVYKAAVDTHSGSLSMDTIPRYLDSLSLSHTGTTETTASFKWTCSPARNYTWYSLDGGAWTGAGDSVASDGKSGTFSISGLAAGSTHTLKVKLRRSDSNLESETNTVTFTTYKYPYLTSKPNFKIGDSLSIGFYNPLQRKVYIYIQNPKGTEKGGDNTTGTSISGYNNEDWKNFFYAGIPDSSSGTYKVRIKCDTGSVNTTETGGTYTIRSEDSEKPTFDATYITSLTNSLNTDISGTDKFIKNHNKLNVIIKPMVLNKSANGKEYSISATGLTTITKAYSTSNITFEMGNMSTNTINVTAYDKRGLYRSASKTITLIDYNNPKISNVKINRENGIGTKALIEVTGSYTNWSGLLKTNTIQTIQYRTKLSTASSYGSWTNLPSDAVKTVSGGSWKLTAKLSDTFVNTSNYNIQFKFNDLLETVESSSYVIGTAEALLWRDLANKRVGIKKKPDYDFDVAGTANFETIRYGERTMKQFKLTGGDGNTNGYREVYRATLGVWANFRCMLMVGSRHSGNGFVMVSVSADANNISGADIKYFGDMTQYYTDAWILRWTASTREFGIYWRYSDYTPCDVVVLNHLSCDLSKMGNGTWYTALPTFDSSLNARYLDTGMFVKGVKTLSAVGTVGWTDQADGDKYLISKAFMAFWNGAYSGTSSNLTYCNKGAFNTAITLPKEEVTRRGHWAQIDFTRKSYTWSTGWSLQYMSTQQTFTYGGDQIKNPSAGVLQVASAGAYLIIGECTKNNPSSDWGVKINVNGTQKAEGYQQFSSGWSHVTAAWAGTLNANDKVQLGIMSGASGTYEVLNNSTMLTVIKLY